MEIRSVGIDLGKTTLHLVALGDKLIAFIANMQTCLIGMDASLGSRFPRPCFTGTRP
jgi:transposase